MKDKTDLVKLWIKKAENDLMTAKHCLNIKPVPPLDTICFHAQQCAEKHLKAYLVYQDVGFEKIHDLVELLKLAIKTDKTFNRLIELGKKLTPYAVDIRYPGILPEELNFENAKSAIEMSEKIKRFVIKKLAPTDER